MKIIDAQVHIWSQTVIPPGGGHRQVPSLSAEELLVEMAEAGVDAGLIHPPASWDPTSNALSIEAAKKYPERFAVMGQFPPDNPDNVRLIPGWRQQPGMMGLRWALLYGEQPRLVVDGKLWGLIACHHRTPRFVSYAVRATASLYAIVMSAQLKAKQASLENLRMSSARRMALDRVATW